MKLLLVCETAIVERIFSLVCNKVNIDLTVQKNYNIKTKYDLIVIDQNYIDDRFNTIKQHANKLGAISSEELPFNKSCNFIIPRPFLPSNLIKILTKEIDLFRKEGFVEIGHYEDLIADGLKGDDYIEDDKVTISKSEYEEILANKEKEDNVQENNPSEDESIIKVNNVNSGGVLDKSELFKINKILKEKENSNRIRLDKEDWENISNIIDNSLDKYDIDEKNDDFMYDLVLDSYQVNELKPFFEKLNDTIVEKISDGKVVNIRISLKD